MRNSLSRAFLETLPQQRKRKDVAFSAQLGISFAIPRLIAKPWLISAAGESGETKAAVTPVPKFLFSEQKLKMLPQGGPCAMFFIEGNNPPVAARPIESRVVIR